MLDSPNALWTAAATILDVAFYSYTAMHAGNMRGRHKIQAPACTGHPEFERALRVQMNTIESMVTLLPMMWIATLWPIIWGGLPALIGVIWFVGRIIYMREYLADPATRRPGATIGALCNMAVLLLATLGVVRALFVLAQT
jgi:glutathione S-transferase